MSCCCKHHRSKFTIAAVVLCCIGWILNLTVILAAVPATITLIAVCCVICLPVPPKCLTVTAILAVVSAICAFATAAQYKHGTGMIVSVIGGLLWLVNSYLVYKIPPPPSVDGDAALPQTNTTV